MLAVCSPGEGQDATAVGRPSRRNELGCIDEKWTTGGNSKSSYLALLDIVESDLAAGLTTAGQTTPGALSYERTHLSGSEKTTIRGEGKSTQGSLIACENSQLLQSLAIPFIQVDFLVLEYCPVSVSVTSESICYTYFCANGDSGAVSGDRAWGVLGLELVNLLVRANGFYDANFDNEDSAVLSNGNRLGLRRSLERSLSVC